jgi:hypothetical protein
MDLARLSCALGVDAGRADRIFHFHISGDENDPRG